MAERRHRVAALVVVVALASLASSCSGFLGSLGPEPFTLNLLTSRPEAGAVCLDGSPGAYYFRPGSGAGAKNFLLYFAGGGWCYDEQDCHQRSLTDLGSSRALPKAHVLDLPVLSQDPAVNPDFHDWSVAWAVYCDGASFSGDVSQAVPVSAVGESGRELESRGPTGEGDAGVHELYFRGRRIREELVRELIETRGLGQEGDLLITGCSAGGLTTILHADQVAAQVRRSRPRDNAGVIKAAPDSGFFPAAKDVHGAPDWPDKMRHVFAMQNVTGSLPGACLRHHASHPSRCFFAETAYQYLSTPSFLINSIYDDWTRQNIYGMTDEWIAAHGTFADNIARLNRYAKAWAAKVAGGPGNSTWTRHDNGGFIQSCMTHCGSLNTPEGWTGVRNEWTGETARDALGNWYFERVPDWLRRSPACEWSTAEPFQCNPTCPPGPWPHSNQAMSGGNP